MAYLGDPLPRRRQHLMRRGTRNDPASHLRNAGDQLPANRQHRAPKGGCAAFVSPKESAIVDVCVCVWKQCEVGRTTSNFLKREHLNLCEETVQRRPLPQLSSSIRHMPTKSDTVFHDIMTSELSSNEVR